MNNATGADPCPLAAPLGNLSEEVAELREGQHELLRMYEELREFRPRRCRCVARAERARQELAARDVFAPEPDHEDYVPGGNDR